MADIDFPRDVFDELDEDIQLDDLFSNKRIAVRYRRNDIKAVIKTHSLFFPRLLQVVLQDVSSKGASVISPTKMRHKSRVYLYLLFNDGRRFEIKATVVHVQAAPRYGLKFDNYHEPLAEHLLATQTDLHFG